MLNSIMQTGEEVRSTLIRINQQIAVLKLQVSEIETMMDTFATSGDTSPESRSSYMQWLRKRNATAESLSYLLFSVNQIRAAMDSIEQAEKYYREYEKVEKNE